MMVGGEEEWVALLDLCPAQKLVTRVQPGKIKAEKKGKNYERQEVNEI